jgi:hypothetical protein
VLLYRDRKLSVSYCARFVAPNTAPWVITTDCVRAKEYILAGHDFIFIGRCVNADILTDEVDFITVAPPLVGRVLAQTAVSLGMADHAGYWDFTWSGHRSLAYSLLVCPAPVDHQHSGAGPQSSAQSTCKWHPRVYPQFCCLDSDSTIFPLRVPYEGQALLVPYTTCGRRWWKCLGSLGLR